MNNNEMITQAPHGKAKYINIHRNDSGEVMNMTEVEIDQKGSDSAYDPFEALREVELPNGRKVHIELKEALLGSPDAAEILRQGIRFLAFDRFKKMPPTYADIVTNGNSSKPQEEYLRDASIGSLPAAPSGTPAPSLMSSFEGGTTIVNVLYRGIFEILGDWVKFDQIGKIKQTSNSIGRALAQTREKAVYTALTTTGNYARNSTTNDNDVGANTAATTFNGVGLELALATVATSKDRKSGDYLGYRADTIVIGPRMEVPVKQLLMSTNLNRAGGNTTNEVRGSGDANQYKGLLNKIIISPWFPTGVNAYQWLVYDSSVEWAMLNEVESPNVLQEDANMTSESWLIKDVIRFLGRDYFGTGIVDDRAAFYSSSTTAPTVS